MAGRPGTWAVLVIQEGIARHKRGAEEGGTGRGDGERPAEGHEWGPSQARAAPCTDRSVWVELDESITMSPWKAGGMRAYMQPAAPYCAAATWVVPQFHTIDVRASTGIPCECGHERFKWRGGGAPAALRSEAARRRIQSRLPAPALGELPEVVDDSEPELSARVIPAAGGRPNRRPSLRTSVDRVARDRPPRRGRRLGRIAAFGQAASYS